MCLAVSTEIENAAKLTAGSQPTAHSSKLIALTSPVSPEQTQQEEEDVQQVEVDVDRCFDVIIRAVHVPDAPRVEDHEAAEAHDPYDREPELTRGAREEHRQDQRADEHEQSDGEEAPPCAEVTPAHERVRGKNDERAEGERRGL